MQRKKESKISNDSKYQEMLRCPVCGTENQKGAEVCKECGAPLSSEESKKDKDSVAAQQSAKKESTKKKKASDKNKNQQSVKTKPNEISTVKIVYTTIALVIVGGIILYSSGIFDEPDVPVVNQQQQFDDFHRGADMSKLQEINNLRTQVESNPDDHEAMLHLAHLLNDSGFKEESIKWYREYLKDHPDAADVWVDMGVCYFDMDDFETAISSMKKGIEINPQHQIAHFNLGIVNYTKGDVQKAKEWWNKAIDLNPGSDIAARAKELIQNN